MLVYLSVLSQTIVRKVIRGYASKDTEAGKLISTRLGTVTLEQTITDCTELITKKRIRHLYLLVLEDGPVAGIISTSDVVGAIISNQASMTEHLCSVYHLGPTPPLFRAGMLRHGICRPVRSAAL